MPDVEQSSTRVCLYNAVNFLSCPSAQPCVWCITGLLFSRFKEALRANLSVDHPTFCSYFPQCSVVYDSLQLHDCSPPCSSVHDLLQERILYWVVISSSRESSRLRDRMQVLYVFCVGRQVLYHPGGLEAILENGF